MRSSPGNLFLRPGLPVVAAVAGLACGVISLHVLGPADPFDPAAPQSNEWFLKGTLLASQNRLDDAIGAFENARSVSPRNPDIDFTLGMMWSRKQNWRQAESCFSLYAKRRPEKSLGWLMLGISREHLKDFPGARDAYGRASRLNPSSEDVQHALQRVQGK